MSQCTAHDQIGNVAFSCKAQAGPSGVCRRHSYQLRKAAPNRKGIVLTKSDILPHRPHTP